MITYVDTSFLIKLLVQEPGSTKARELWDASDVLIATRIGYVEARAALAGAHRAGRISASQWVSARDRLEHLWPQLRTIEVSVELATSAGEVAETAALRGYDAMHLAAALLVTADTVASSDQDLIRAARSYGLHTSDPTAN